MPYGYLGVSSMSLCDLLNSPIGSLPQPPRRNSFSRDLHALFDQYVAQVQRMTGNDYATQLVRSEEPKINQLAQDLLSVLDDLLRGQPSGARLKLERAIHGVQPYFDGFLSNPIDGNTVGVLYRIRNASYAGAVDRSKIFHPPFEKRHRVGTQRFSIPGVPMLYLGSTLYVCWEELGRPDLSKLWVAAFKLRDGQNVRLLDFAYRPGYMSQLLESALLPQNRTDIAHFVASYAIIWPLVAASTFQVPDRSVPFVVEYAIPQLLMSWIAETDDVDGARYFSARGDIPPAASQASVNYVLTASDYQEDGFSAHLSDLFEFTQPVSWDYVEAVGTQTTPLVRNRFNTVLRLVEGHGVPYEGTAFARMEACLDLLPFNPLA